MWHRSSVEPKAAFVEPDVAFVVPGATFGADASEVAGTPDEARDPTATLLASLAAGSQNHHASGDMMFTERI
jgi:hypothetical protein